MSHSMLCALCPTPCRVRYAPLHAVCVLCSTPCRVRVMSHSMPCACYAPLHAVCVLCPTPCRVRVMSHSMPCACYVPLHAVCVLCPTPCRVRVMSHSMPCACYVPLHAVCIMSHSMPCVCYVLRNRTKHVYTIFSRKPASEVHSILHGMGVDYVIVEDGWCRKNARKPGMLVYSFVPRLSALVQIHCAEFNSHSIMHKGGNEAM